MLDKSEFKKFVDAGYKNKREANEINGYVLDKELSTKRDKIYVHPKTGKAKHVIAGTDSLKDWSNNILIPLGLHHHTNRYKNSESIQKKANEKYGKQNVDLITHSQSGNIAENLAKRGLVGGENTSLNPAIMGKHHKDLKVVKSLIDPVSVLTKTNSKDKILGPSSINPITEHSTSILGNGSKGKGSNINNMKNLNHLREQDLIDRMAKLSHDMHLHHKTHGMRPSLIKGYKIMGEGIKHSASIHGQGLFAGDADTFNQWMKKTGDAFKSIQPYAESVWEEIKNYGKGEDRVHQEYLAKQKEQKEQAEKNQQIVQGLEEKPKRKKFKKMKKTKKQKEENYEIPTATLIEDDDHEDTFNKMYKPAVKQPVTMAHEINHYENEPTNDSPTSEKYTNAFTTMPSSYERSWQSKYGRGLHGEGFFDDIGNKISGSFNEFGSNMKSIADVGINDAKRSKFINILKTAPGTYSDAFMTGINEIKKAGDYTGEHLRTGEPMRLSDGTAPLSLEQWKKGKPFGGNGVFDDMGRYIKDKGTYYGKKTAKLLNNEGIPYATGKLGEYAGEYFGVPPPLARIAGTYAGKRIARHINRNTELGGYGIKQGRGRPLKGLEDNLNMARCKKVEQAVEKAKVSGTGTKRKGRMVKGSPEAMAWAEKMRMARSKGPDKSGPKGKGF